MDHVVGGWRMRDGFEGVGKRDGQYRDDDIAGDEGGVGAFVAPEEAAGVVAKAAVWLLKIVRRSVDGSSLCMVRARKF
jgi:hypothetical protein